MVGDVTLAALARLGKLTEIVAEPWPRAQASAARGRNMLIIPLSRTPEREELYTWIAPVMELERAFFSLDEPVTSFAEARQRYRRIGVGLGTAQVAILQREGFRDEQIVQLTSGENPVHLLNLGAYRRLVHRRAGGSVYLGGFELSPAESAPKPDVGQYRPLSKLLEGMRCATDRILVQRHRRTRTGRYQPAPASGLSAAAA